MRARHTLRIRTPSNVLNIVIPLSLASQVHRHTQIFRSISLFAIIEPIFTQQAETHIPDLHRTEELAEGRDVSKEGLESKNKKLEKCITQERFWE